MFEFKMPSMGADMESAVLTKWNYGVGDEVKKGDVICEIETAKGDIDVEVWESGTLTEIVVQEGARVPVGEVLALIDTGVETPVSETEPENESEPETQTETETVSESETEPENDIESESDIETELEPEPENDIESESDIEPKPALGAGLASPAARKRAAELGIDLAALQGTGPGGAIKLADLEAAEPHHHHRITPVARNMAEAEGIDPDSIEATGEHDTVTKKDVERAIARSADGPVGKVSADTSTEKAEESERQDPLRDAIAKAMARSKREIPHYYLQRQVDVTETLDWLTTENEGRSVKERLVFGALAARAVALAAAEIPEMNGLFEDGRFEPSSAVNVGFAIAMRGGGVVAPAILDTANKNLDETMAAIKDLVRRVRRGKLKSSEMTESTITVTSLGDLGVDTVYGVIYPPQVAIVGIGSPRETAIAHDGMVGVRTCVDLTLSGDHRVSDGLVGARFLQLVEGYLQDPESLKE